MSRSKEIKNEINLYKGAVTKIKSIESLFDTAKSQITSSLGLMPITFNLNGVIYGYDELSGISGEFSAICTKLSSLKSEINKHIADLELELAAEEDFEAGKYGGYS